MVGPFDRDVLGDEQRAVGADPDGDVSARQAVGVRRRGERERDERGREDEAFAEPAQLAGAVPKSTRGASRVTSSVWKYSRGLKLNMPAMTFVGTVSSAFSYVSTVSL